MRLKIARLIILLLCVSFFTFSVPAALVFAAVSHTITATAGPGGAISPAGAVSAPYGTDQGFTITPALGYHIIDVLVDGVSVGAVSSYTFTNVTANHNITASFAVNTYTITASAGTNGTISPAGAVSAVFGSNQSFTITPDTHYHVADVLVDGVSVGAVSSYTFTNVTSNHTITASFAIDTYTITASAGSGGAISPDGAVSVAYGNDQAFTITPDPGNPIVDVTVDGASVGAVSSYTFTNVTADHAIHASFRNSPLLTIQKAGAGNGTVTSTPAGIGCGATCSYHFADGLEVTLTAAPDAGSAFDGFSGGNCQGNGECILSLDQDETLTATFNPDGDSDGISDLTEDGGPYGGDGNQDGTLDSLQANVATFKGINGSYVTLVSEAGTDLVDVMATVNPSWDDAPAGCIYPQGFFGFTVKGIAPGAATTVQIILHEKDTTLSAYYKYGPTPDNHADHWYWFFFLTNGQTGADITQGETQTTILLSFVDGKRGDDDLSANGEITDVGGPAELTGKGSSDCFIATAAYGSSMEPEVKILREFRDRYLLSNSVGKVLVRFYYAFSPPVAYSLSNHDILRGLVRWGLLPIVGMSWIMLRLGPLAAIVLVLCFFAGFRGIAGLKRQKKKI